MSGVSIVFVTAGSEEEALKIGRTLVAERLAACANIVPGIRSVYRWKGEICSDSEFLLIVKTRSSLFSSLMKRVLDLHSYEVPEIVTFPVDRGLPAYLDWVLENTLQEDG